MSSGIRRTISTALTVANILVTPPTTALAQDDKPICPDRPGRGTSPCTLEDGRVQLELGLFDDSYQHRSDITTDSDNAGSLLAKWGVSDRMDVEAGLALYQRERVSDASGATTLKGIGDLFLHAKYNPLTGDGPFAYCANPSSAYSVTADG